MLGRCLIVLSVSFVFLNSFIADNTHLHGLPVVHWCCYVRIGVRKSSKMSKMSMMNTLILLVHISIIYGK